MGEARRRKLLVSNNQAAAPLMPSDGLWPLSNANTLRQLESWFIQRGVDPAKPGVHDTAAFLEAETRDAKAMNFVARLVEARNYSAAELLLAERKIVVAANAIAGRVARDGRHGLCVVASGILSRILDELHVWNYTAKSNLAIQFPSTVSTGWRYFYSIDSGNFTAPHAIVVAPPFAVIDVTVKHQMYDNAAMSQYLPELVATKEFRPCRVSAAELISPEARAELKMHGVAAEEFLSQDRGDMLELMMQLPAREVSMDGGRLRYGIVAVGGYQEQLRDLDVAHCNIDGMTAMEIFEQDVLPKL